jgi:hypothetical protein
MVGDKTGSLEATDIFSLDENKSSANFSSEEASLGADLLDAESEEFLKDKL